MLEAMLATVLLTQARAGRPHRGDWEYLLEVIGHSHYQWRP